MAHVTNQATSSSFPQARFLSLIHPILLSLKNGNLGLQFDILL